jgi:tetratricopeptide (TPR) repeat protein
VTQALEATLDQVDELRDGGRYADAEAILRPLLARVDIEHGARSLAAAQVRNAYGLLLKATGRYAQARSCYRVALDILESAYGSTDDLAALHHNLAGIDFVLGYLGQAISWGRRGLDLRRTVAGSDDLPVLFDEGNLAPILIAAGELEEAERLLTHVHEQFVAQLGADDYEVAVALTNLGALAAERGDLPAALSHLTEAVRIKSARLGPEHPDLIRTLINVAVVAENLGDLDRSVQAHARARSIAEAALPADHELLRTLQDW